MPAPQRIKDLVEKFTANFAYYQSTDYNEEELRHDFLNPLFQELGWDMEDKANRGALRDVHYETRTKGGAPDIGFYLDGQLKFFVEAKNPTKNVCTDPTTALQLRTYGWSAKINRSVLSDFEEFSIYDTTVRPKYTDKANVARLHCIKYTEYLDRWDEIAAVFSREAVAAGSLEKLEMKRTKQAVDDELLEDISRWREALAKNIALRNESLTEEQVNRAVQDTLDRMIFLRICEDRRIEPENRLREAAEGTEIYKSLFKIFRNAEERYDSGLFDLKTIAPDLKIDDKTLSDIISELYFPKSPYKFDAIPAEILGQVYEQFLGKVIRLTAGHHAKVEDKPEVRKAGGVYYTPSYIVNYIVKNTVGKLVEGKNPKDIEELTVLDPACGSGSFLIGAYQYLMDWYRDWYVAHGEEKYKKANIIHQDKDGEWQLTLAERTRILLAHIFGVDIDRQAVEVAKLSLMLKALETPGQISLLEKRMLPDLSNNIKCGNSLISTDYFAGQLTPDPAEMARINAFDWETEFSEIFKRGGFDVVIGNPPWGADIDREIEYFHEKYPATTKEHTDSYKLFIEAAINRVVLGGLVSMIVPGTLIGQRRLKDVRALLMQHQIINVTNLGENVFENVIAPSCIFVVSKEKMSEGHWVSLIDASRLSNREKAILLDHAHSVELLNQTEFSKNTDLDFSFARNKFHVPVQMLGDFKGLLCKDAGINYQRVGVGMREKGKSDLAQRLLYDGIQQKSRDKMYWRGADIDRYWAAETTEHFCRPNYKDFIRENEVVHLSPGIYEIVPKILLRQTADRLIATIDNRGVWFARSILSIIPKGSLYEAEYFLGLLNSRYYRYLYQNLVQESGRAFAQVKLSKIKQLPVRLIDFNNLSEKKAHDDIVIAVKEIMALRKQYTWNANPQQQQAFQRQINATDQQIDQLVYKLYSLTEEEIKIIEEATK